MNTVGAPVLLESDSVTCQMVAGPSLRRLAAPAPFDWQRSRAIKTILRVCLSPKGDSVADFIANMAVGSRQHGRALQNLSLSRQHQLHLLQEMLHLQRQHSRE